MTNAEQFRIDMKATGLPRVKYQGKPAVKLDKFSRVLEVGAATLVLTTYKWVSNNCVYVFPVQPDLPYEPAFHVVKYHVMHYTQDGFYGHCCFTSTKKQTAFLEALAPYKSRVKAAEHIVRQHKASVYSLRFYKDSVKVCQVHVANKQIGRYFASRWKRQGTNNTCKLQKDLKPISEYKIPEPPMQACTVF